MIFYFLTNFLNAYTTFLPDLALTSINYILQYSPDNYYANFYPYQYFISH